MDKHIGILDLQVNEYQIDEFVIRRVHTLDGDKWSVFKYNFDLRHWQPRLSSKTLKFEEKAPWDNTRTFEVYVEFDTVEEALGVLEQYLDKEEK